MNSHARSFFATSKNSASIVVNQHETALNTIKKIIDAELSYMKCLAEQMLKGSDEECVRIFALINYLEPSDLPAYLGKPVMYAVKQVKQKIINGIIGDIKKYEVIKSLAAADCVDFDALYLYVSYFCQENTFLLKRETKDELKARYSKLFDINLSSKRMNTIYNCINNFSAEKTPHFQLACEMELLNLLRPKISSTCRKYSELFHIEFQKDGYVDVPFPAQYRHEIANFLDDLKLCANKFQSDELMNLGKKLIVIAMDMGLRKTNSTSILDYYLELFTSFKKFQGIHSETVLLMNDLIKPKVQEEIAKQPDAIMIEVEEEKPDIAMNSDDLSGLEQVLPENEIVVEEDKENYFDHYFFNARKKISSNPDSIESKNDKRLIQIDEKNFEKYKDHNHDTFLKVFGQIDYISISIRELVSLVLALNGTFTHSGANRCRLEIGSIYAYAIMTAEDCDGMSSKQCQKATITFHGSAKSQKKSQRDQGAPQYLIAQFKVAFERAGFTPDRLHYEYRSATKTNNVNNKMTRAEK